MLPKRSFFLLILSLFLMLSCKETKFNGDVPLASKSVEPALDISENENRTNNPVPGGTLPDGRDPDINDPNSPINNPRREVMTFRCGGENDASIGEFSFTGRPDERIHAQIRGEFCPSATQKMNVVFLVDFSASMGKWRKTTADTWRDGNDPLRDGSCGRLRAIQAVMNKLQPAIAKGDSINVASIAFAGDIVEDYSDKQFINAQNYNPSADRTCRFVAATTAQDAQAPGAIAPRSGFLGMGKLDGHTNYQAAFERASSLIQGKEGRTVVYFISDGEPTLPSTDTIQASVTAGQKMRNSSGNITVNALMLGAEEAGAKEVLKKVTGSDRILHANNASELDEKILTFPEPTIDTNSLRASVNVTPYPEKELGILQVSRTNTTVWLYHTQPFVLLGRPGETVENILKVTAAGPEGSIMTSVITIKYTQTN